MKNATTGDLRSGDERINKECDSFEKDNFKSFQILILNILKYHFEPLIAALAVGITYAQTRLKKKNIFTVSPKRINLCGSGEFSNFA